MALSTSQSVKALLKFSSHPFSIQVCPTVACFWRLKYRDLEKSFSNYSDQSINYPEEALTPSPTLIIILVQNFGHIFLMVFQRLHPYVLFTSSVVHLFIKPYFCVMNLLPKDLSSVMNLHSHFCYKLLLWILGLLIQGHHGSSCYKLENPIAKDLFFFFFFWKLPDQSLFLFFFSSQPFHRKSFFFWKLPFGPELIFVLFLFTTIPQKIPS